jgi:hypothetical protein
MSFWYKRKELAFRIALCMTGQSYHCFSSIRALNFYHYIGVVPGWIGVCYSLWGYCARLFIQRFAAGLTCIWSRPSTHLGIDGLAILIPNRGPPQAALDSAIWICLSCFSN